LARCPHILYTAEAAVIGGRAAGRGVSADGSLAVDLRSPRELGGDGGGTNPEELFAIGYAACCGSALALVARRERLDMGDAFVASVCRCSARAASSR
jgi:Ohr subfamily peroxiredoxin